MSVLFLYSGIDAEKVISPMNTAQLRIDRIQLVSSCEQRSISRESLCCHEVGAISQKMLDSGNDVDCEAMRAYRNIKIYSYSNISIRYHLAIINVITLYFL